MFWEQAHARAIADHFDCVHIGLVADAIPKFDVKQEDAQGKLLQDWAQYSPAQRTGCVRFSSRGSSPSYVELLTCLEMAKQAKDLPEASKMGTSGQR